jgi:type 1 glutamine amidotransferase
MDGHGSKDSNRKQDNNLNGNVPMPADNHSARTPAATAAVNRPRATRWSWSRWAELGPSPGGSLSLGRREPNPRLFWVRFVVWLVLAALTLGSAALGALQAAEPGKIRVLIMTGGHDFETNAFFDMFKANPDITWETAIQPAADALLRPKATQRFDVLVRYDMWQPISDEAKTNLMRFLASGRGMVCLHHSIANYQTWPEWHRMIGGRYYLNKTVVDGVEKPRSIWKHDVRFRVHVTDPNHPVTRGVSDFEIHDETYGLFDMAPDSHLLLTTDEPTSAKHIGWARTYTAPLPDSRPARVVYIQLGHDHLAYQNPSYQRLVRQAIGWVAGRL